MCCLSCGGAERCQARGSRRLAGREDRVRTASQKGRNRGLCENCLHARSRWPKAPVRVGRSRLSRSSSLYSAAPLRCAGRPLYLFSSPLPRCTPAVPPHSLPREPQRRPASPLRVPTNVPIPCDQDFGVRAVLPEKASNISCSLPVLGQTSPLRAPTPKAGEVRPNQHDRSLRSFRASEGAPASLISLQTLHPASVGVGCSASPSRVWAPDYPHSWAPAWHLPQISGRRHSISLRLGLGPVCFLFPFFSFSGRQTLKLLSAPHKDTGILASSPEEPWG